MAARAHRAEQDPQAIHRRPVAAPGQAATGRAPWSGRAPRSGPALPVLDDAAVPRHGTRRSRLDSRDRDAEPSGGDHRHPPAQAVPGGADCGSAHLRLTEQEVRLSPRVGHDQLVGQFPGRGGHPGLLAGGPSARTSPAARPRPGTSGPPARAVPVRNVQGPVADAVGRGNPDLQASHAGNVSPRPGRRVPGGPAAGRCRPSIPNGRISAAWNSAGNHRKGNGLAFPQRTQARTEGVNPLT